MAIDRETLTDVVLAGYSFPATGGFVPPRMLGHSPGIGLPYDPAQARKLLAEAGYPGGRGLPTIDALLLDRPTSQRAADFIQTCWHDHLGVESTWTLLGYTDLFEASTYAHAHVGPVRWMADYPDPDNFLRVASSHYRLLSRWTDAAFGRLVEDARTMTNPRNRVQAYQEADRILIQSAALVPLFYGRTHLLLKPWLRNYTLSPSGDRFWKDVIIDPH
jgi:ABC-type transport system substrate-binding protein